MSFLPDHPRQLRGPGTRARLYKIRRKRESLDQSPYRDTEGGPVVIKGISKRIIVVKSPDPKIFEQAIFIVREDFVGQTGISQRELMRQAKHAADSFVKNSPAQSRLIPWLRGVMYAVAGAGAAALAWVMMQMSHVM